MTIHCNLHPSRPAHFQCRQCDTAFCGQCISKRSVQAYGGMESSYFCPICNVEAEQLDIGNIIEPFWQRLPKFFCYPLQLQPMILMTTVSVLAVLDSESFIAGLCALFGIIFNIKYGYSILTSTARGSLKAPRILGEPFSSGVSQVAQLYLLFLVLVTLRGVALHYAGPLGGTLYTLAIFPLLPAMIMVLVATNSVIAALNPMIVLPIMVRIGYHYLLMLLFLLLLPMAPASLVGLLGHVLPWRGLVFMQIFSMQYYAVIMFNLMGYVLLQYHEEIGYQVDYSHFSTSSLAGLERPHSQNPEQVLLHRLNLLIKSGHHREALVAAREDILLLEESVEISEKYYSLLKICHERSLFCQYAPRHLDLLVNRNERTKGIEVYHELAEDKEITLSADAVFTIAHWLYERDAYSEAAACYRKFLQDYPQDSRLFEAWMETIKLFHEHFNKTGQAIKMAEAVLVKYPGHALVPKLKAYLQSMG